jgi:lysophospholipase L1-like esterase
MYLASRGLFLLITLCFGMAQAETPLPLEIFKNLEAGKKQTVVVYGTSLTHGGAWTKALHDWFEKQYPQQVKFINSGGPGQNSDWGRAQLANKVLAHHPDLVILEFSYNDAHAKFKLSVERAAENLAAMVKALREQNPQMSIILQTMNVPWDAPGDRLPAANRPELQAYNDNYRTLAKEESLPFVDHYLAWKVLFDQDPRKYRRWLPDGSHPSAEASVAVTWKGLRTMLEQAQATAKTEAPK